MVELFTKGDASLPHVSTSAVMSALDDFALPLVPNSNMEWLATAVRRLLAVSVRRTDEDPDDGQSNSVTRDNLFALADRANGLHNELVLKGRPEDFAIVSYGYERQRFGLGEMSDDDLNFKLALRQLHWLAGFLRGAALHMDSKANQQSPRWRDAARREIRIERGCALAQIFEATFGSRVTVNMGQSVGAQPTPFMDFYQRMVALAFGEKATPDLTGILQEARTRHLAWLAATWGDANEIPSNPFAAN